MSEVYAAVEAIAREAALATSAVSDARAVSRSAYYAWLGGEPAPRERERESLAETIRAIFWRHRRRYGARRIAAELKDRGIACSSKRVAKLMRGLGLRAIQPKSFVPKTTESRHGLGYSPNLLLDATEPTGLGQRWVGDITYLPLRRGRFCYLAALMDRFSRDIVGWSVAASMTEPLVLAALRQAIRSRQPKPGLIHTDRGGQYAGTRYRAVLGRAGMRQSMSRADHSGVTVCPWALLELAHFGQSLRTRAGGTAPCPTDPSRFPPAPEPEPGRSAPMAGSAEPPAGGTAPTSHPPVGRTTGRPRHSDGGTA